MREARFFELTQGRMRKRVRRRRIDDQVKVLCPLRGGPANEVVSGGDFPGGGAEAQGGEQVRSSHLIHAVRSAVYQVAQLGT